MTHVCDTPVAHDLGSPRTVLRTSLRAHDCPLDMHYVEKVEPGQWFVMLGQMGEGDEDPPPKTSKYFFEEEDGEPSPTSFSGASGGRQQRGFAKPGGPSAPSTSEPVDNFHGLPLPPLMSPSDFQSSPRPPTSQVPRPAKAEKASDGDLSLGFRKSTDKKKFLVGVMMCCGEAGPTWQDIEEFLGLDRDLTAVEVEEPPTDWKAATDDVLQHLEPSLETNDTNQDVTGPIEDARNEMANDFYDFLDDLGTWLDGQAEESEEVV